MKITLSLLIMLCVSACAGSGGNSEIYGTISGGVESSKRF